MSEASRVCTAIYDVAEGASLLLVARDSGLLAARLSIVARELIASAEDGEDEENEQILKSQIRRSRRAQISRARSGRRITSASYFHFIPML